MRKEEYALAWMRGWRRDAGCAQQGDIADARRRGGEQLAERCNNHDHVERHGDGRGGCKGRGGLGLCFDQS